MTQTEEANGSSTEILEPPFDVAKDAINSFSELQRMRSRIYAKRHDFDRFARRVEELDDTGEAGRRKGLGLWMLSRFEEAVALLDRYADDDVASFTCANALMSLDRPADALPIFQRLSEKHPRDPRPRGGGLTARLEGGIASDDERIVDAVRAALKAAPAVTVGDHECPFAESAEGHFLLGRCAELERDWQTAIDEYLSARRLDPYHRQNLFRLGFVAERNGLDELALEAYTQLASMPPTDHAVLINLGVLYEDLGREQDAAACYDTVAKTLPTDRRARLYLEDARAGMEMYYDEDMEKKEDRLNQIFRIPITDFELSVRARNCLNKMNILTLGDLVRKTEAELLSYKNFGETSLNEIKEILGAKGLRLGMAREEAVASIAKHRPVYGSGEGDTMNKPMSDLKLSIRARRTVENLGCLTVGDITAHTEDELLGMPNFGVTSLMELKNKLSELGLKLKGD